jgi:hypothetical protein
VRRKIDSLDISIIYPSPNRMKHERLLQTR